MFMIEKTPRKPNGKNNRIFCTMSGMEALLPSGSTKGTQLILETFELINSRYETRLNGIKVPYKMKTVKSNHKTFKPGKRCLLSSAADIE
jgi:hypothetical protein